MDSALGECLIYQTYDLINYGDQLKRIREQCRLTQLDVSALCGVNRDTLRRIEQGTVIPKYETLELLTQAYKTDVVKMMNQHRLKHRLNKYEVFISEYLVNADWHSFEMFKAHFEETCLTSEEGATESRAVLQMKGLMEALELLHASPEEAMASLKAVLRFQNETWSEHTYKSFTYTLLELKTLMILSHIPSTSNELFSDLSLFEFVLAELESRHASEDRLYALLPLTYYLMAMKALQLQQPDRGLRIAQEGILYCQQHQTLFAFAELLRVMGYCKAKLKDTTFVLDLEKSRQVYKIVGKSYKPLFSHEDWETYEISSV